MTDETYDLLSPTIFTEDTPEPVAIETPAPVVVEPVAVVPEPVKEQMVPLAALQAERAESKAIKERLAAVDAMLARQNAPKPPDALTEPEQFNAYMEQQLESRVANVELNFSERLARDKHGSEFVDAAFAAAQQNGAMQQFIGKKDAWGDLAAWYKTQAAMAEIGNDPVAYRARVVEEERRKILADMALQSVIPAAPSLAGQSNIGTRAAPSWSGPASLEDILK